MVRHYYCTTLTVAQGHRLKERAESRFRFNGLKISFPSARQVTMTTLGDDHTPMETICEYVAGYLDACDLTK